jgi:hypothetical protein
LLWRLHNANHAKLVQLKVAGATTVAAVTTKHDDAVFSPPPRLALIGKINDAADDWCILIIARALHDRFFFIEWQRDLAAGK